MIYFIFFVANVVFTITNYMSSNFIFAGISLFAATIGGIGILSRMGVIKE